MKKSTLAGLALSTALFGGAAGNVQAGTFETYTCDSDMSTRIDLIVKTKGSLRQDIDTKQVIDDGLDEIIGRLSVFEIMGGDPSLTPEQMAERPANAETPMMRRLREKLPPLLERLQAPGGEPVAIDILLKNGRKAFSPGCANARPYVISVCTMEGEMLDIPLLVRGAMRPDSDPQRVLTKAFEDVYVNTEPTQDEGEFFSQVLGPALKQATKDLAQEGRPLRFSVRTPEGREDKNCRPRMGT